MSSSYGERFRFTIFGQSHAPAIGVTMEGIPAGFEIDMEKLQPLLIHSNCSTIVNAPFYTLYYIGFMPYTLCSTVPP